MHTRFFTAIVVAAIFATPGVAAAQDVGIMQSAETINRDNFKILGNPMIVFGKDGADDDVGIAASIGYGFTDRFDMEGRVAFYDDLTFVGADAEYWLVRDETLDLSVIGGINRGLSDGLDTTGLEFTLLGSRNVAPALEVYGGLDISRRFVSDSDFDFTTVHLVPGIEYALNEDLDLVGEVGLGITDESHHYLSVGLALYIR